MKKIFEDYIKLKEVESSMHSRLVNEVKLMFPYIEQVAAEHDFPIWESDLTFFRADSSEVKVVVKSIRGNPDKYGVNKEGLKDKDAVRLYKERYPKNGLGNIQWDKDIWTIKCNEISKQLKSEDIPIQLHLSSSFFSK